MLLQFAIWKQLGRTWNILENRLLWNKYIFSLTCKLPWFGKPLLVYSTGLLKFVGGQRACQEYHTSPSHAVDVACFILGKLDDLWGQGWSLGEHRRAVIGSDATDDPVVRQLIVAITVFQIWKFEPSVPFLEATIAGKRHEKRLISKLRTAALFTLWH